MTENSIFLDCFLKKREKKSLLKNFGLIFFLRNEHFVSFTYLPKILKETIFGWCFKD